MILKWRHIGAAMAGFLLSANVHLMPWAASSPRGTDLLGGLFMVWIIVRLARGRQRTGPLVVAGLALVMPMVWVVLGLNAGHASTVLGSARWLPAAAWAVALPTLLADPPDRDRFAWGLLAGCGVGVGVLALQIAGLEPLLRATGLSSAGANFHHFVGGSQRMPGLHGQHNASATVISLAVPVAMYLYFRGRTGWPLVAMALVGFLAASHVTSTRGPVVAMVPTLVYAFVASRQVARGVLLGTAVLAILLPVIVVVGPPGGWSRWRDGAAIAANSGERAASTAGAAELALEHPFGLGQVRGQEALYDRTSSIATHNAFAQAALHWGMPMALVILLGILGSMALGPRGVGRPYLVEGMLACQTAGVFMFEEHLNNPTFMILAMWMMVTAATARRARAAAED